MKLGIQYCYLLPKQKAQHFSEKIAAMYTTPHTTIIIIIYFTN